MPAAASGCYRVGRTPGNAEKPLRSAHLEDLKERDPRLDAAGPAFRVLCEPFTLRLCAGERLFVKGWVGEIDVLLVQPLLGQPDGFTETGRLK